MTLPSAPPLLSPPGSGMVLPRGHQPYGVTDVTLAKAMDAPAATIVGLCPASGPESRTVGRGDLHAALREAAARAGVAGLGPKSGVLVSGDRADGRLRFEFFQGLPDGLTDPGVGTCVNSLTAAVAAARVRWSWALPPGPVPVVMDGALYRVTITSVRGPSLQAAVTLPLGDAEEHLLTVSRTKTGEPYLVTTFPLPYLLLDPGPETFFAPVPAAREAAWEELRRSLAQELRMPISASSPKLGLLHRPKHGPPLFRTRLAAGGRWHPGAPGSGLLAAAAALTHLQPTSMLTGDVSFRTPAGARRITRAATPDGLPGLSLDVTVEVTSTLTGSLR